MFSACSLASMTDVSEGPASSVRSRHDADSAAQREIDEMAAQLEQVQTGVRSWSFIVA